MSGRLLPMRPSGAAIRLRIGSVGGENRGQAMRSCISRRHAASAGMVSFGTPSAMARPPLSAGMAAHCR
jgi:hypothetical protein